MTRPKLYLAGPEVFFPDAAAIGARKKALCAEHGFLGLYPFDASLPVRPTPRAVAFAIHDACRAMMDEADAILANLTPFRGPSADVGTVFELGVMAGLGRPLFGYSNAATPYRDRIQAARFDPARNTWIDTDGTAIEGFGLADNLMIEGALHQSGTHLVQATADPHTDLAAFATCLALARQHFRL